MGHYVLALLNRSVTESIKKYPIPPDEYVEVADHFVATSIFNSTRKVRMYPFQNDYYESLGGINWKK